jgi:DNA (cytosine-5)-methyltransferase 1
MTGIANMGARQTGMNALSLFSGIGGLDLAAEMAGIRTAAMCERDSFCRGVLRKYSIYT